MSTTRVLLTLILLLAIGISIDSSLVSMSYIAGYGSAAEMAAPDTTAARRAELLMGFQNGTAVQVTLFNSIWWLSLLAGLLAVWLLFDSASKRRDRAR